jgi:argininosuccinate lyase
VVDVEDVHSFVETRLGELVGELAGQGHLARSRNEQTVTALRMFVRTACDRAVAALASLVEALCDKGEEGGRGGDARLHPRARARQDSSRLSARARQRPV